MFPNIRPLLFHTFFYTYKTQLWSIHTLLNTDIDKIRAMLIQIIIPPVGNTKTQIGYL